MDKKLTFLEEGICIEINSAELERLKSRMPEGWLDRVNYPPCFEVIA